MNYSCKDWRVDHYPDVQICSNKEKLFVYAAKKFIELVSFVHSTKNNCSVILSGGRTPVEFNKKLIDISQEEKIDWSRVVIFFSDERCVPPDNPASNYKMTYETLIKPLSIPLHNVYRFSGESGPVNAALEYEETLLKVFGEKYIPSFDLAIMGLGLDGHTASLFPKSESLKEKTRLAIPGGKGPDTIERVTLTYPILNGAQNVWFIACGEEKSSIIHSTLEGEFNPTLLPCQGICPTNGKLVYMLDSEAASKIRLIK